MDKEVKFKGKVSRCVYNSESFKVYGMEVDFNEYPEVKKNTYNNVTITGELPDLILGVEYEVNGIETYSKNGVGYKVLNIKRDTPKTEQDMFLFLCEILTHNQATVLFETYPDIVERVKENRLDDIDLNKLKGIKEVTFEKIKRKIIENFCLSDLVIEFKGHLNLSMIKKIYNKYSSIEVLKAKLREDPYKCLCGLAGVGFKTADNILLSIEKSSKENIAKGKEPIFEFETSLKESIQRCLSCVLYLLDENENEGHTKMNVVDLRKLVIETVPECADKFVEAIKSKNIYFNKETMDIASERTYRCENYIANEIKNNVNNTNNKWDYNIEKYRNVNGSMLSDEQINALKNICNYTISILNGSGGTGKSFSTQAVINMLKDHHKSFKLFSPTGKASKVLSDYTGETATTIHRGLGYIVPDGWTYNEENKLSCDVVIIDEFSMVDIWLFRRVIEAIDFNHTKLMMIGDNAQLCSVGCGNLLHDFMQSHIIPTTTLTKVFRYGEGGLMKVATDVRFCKPYLSNTMKNNATTFGSNKDYTFVDLTSEQIPQTAVALYKKLMSKGYGINDIQVLTSKNVGDIGTVVLNNMIQKVANPNYGSKICMTYGDTTYYEGDLVIQKVNNYKAILDWNSLSYEEKEIYGDCEEEDITAFVANGETGIVKSVEHSYILIDFDGVVVKYTKADLINVGLGYSITIHKSQGSSIKAVILLTPQSHTFMLNSNLIYVGLTRMKEICYHLGTLTSVNQAVIKKANLERSTFMQYLLNKEGDTNE